MNHAMPAADPVAERLATHLPVIQDQLRRFGGTRIPAPPQMFYVTPDHAIHKVEFVVRIQTTSCTDELPCRLADISSHGFGVIADDSLVPGELSHVYARCVKSNEILFEEDFFVTRRTRMPGGCNRYHYGFRTGNLDDSKLYQAVLDSIFMEHILSTGSLESLRLAF